jgi:hypothetical protein
VPCTEYDEVAVATGPAVSAAAIAVEARAVKKMSGKTFMA